MKRRTAPKEVVEPVKPDPEKDPLAYYRSLRPQPSVRVISTGTEETEKVRPDKKKANKKKDSSDSESNDEEKDRVL